MRLRIAATAGLFAAVFAVLTARAVQLTVVQGGVLREKAHRQHLQSVPMPARRGPIVDRNGEPLALTRESAAVFVRPQEIDRSPEVLGAVARVLDLPADVVAERAAAKAPFVWLERQVSLSRWEDLARLGIDGIGSEQARQRVYPQGAVAAHVLGFTGIDGQGLEGVERMLDADLRGQVEAMAVERDAWGRRIAADGQWRPLPRVGAKVELTIDAPLQRVAETELQKAVDGFGAKAGSVVVLVPDTGEVLAMANVPRFDPNRFREASPSQWRNRAITDCYEPGSTFKAVLAAEALERGVVSTEDRIFCENGRYPVGRRTIRDSHPHGVLTFADVIAESSNIGAAKVAERLGRDDFGAALERFGFGRPTGIDLPGEASGLVRPIEKWGRIHLVTTAFGQGIAVTPLQLARAFAAIANGGRLMRPYVVRRVVTQSGRVLEAGSPHVDGRMISPQTAATLTAILTRVVETGTGKQAQMEGFTVAGKTGTAQKVDPGTGRYSARDRIASFVGYVPAEDPALVILVVIDTPRKATYGGVVAAPVFRRIAEYGLARRGILPRGVPAPERRHGPATPPVQRPAHQLVTAGVPSFLGLGMREALVRAQRSGWKVEVAGSGYVIAQKPRPGAQAEAREIALTFGSSAS
jgi:cell division protein FtsI (penicillin-binding protein 3)